MCKPFAVLVNVNSEQDLVVYCDEVGAKQRHLLWFKIGRKKGVIEAMIYAAIASVSGDIMVSMLSSSAKLQHVDQAGQTASSALEEVAS